jgi:signal transduction histidine kinase
MLQFLQDLFASSQFAPHGMCLLWRPDLLLLHGASDLFVALAYFTIPIVILKAHKRRPDLIDVQLARLFAVFITVGGVSHVAGFVTLWIPAYGIEGVIMLIAAVVSVYTAIQLVRLLPRFLRNPGREEMARKDAAIMISQLEAEEARSAHAKLNEFAYIVSHDLRAPLRGISNQVNFLKEDHRDAFDPDVKKRMDRITELCEKADSLIVTLLQYSRIGRTQARESVNTRRVIDEVISSLKEFIAERNATVAIETELPCISASPADVDTLFRNLIQNGLTYNDAEAPIVGVGFLDLATIDGKPEQNVFYVRDNGIGIDPEFQDEVFRMFKRLNPPTEYGDGTGAGLAFVRKVVEANGGWIRMVSTPGKGTTFYISLARPIADARIEPRTGGESVQIA